MCSYITHRFLCFILWYMFFILLHFKSFQCITWLIPNYISLYRYNDNKDISISMCRGTIGVEVDIGVLEILYWGVKAFFFRGSRWIFHQDNAIHHFGCVTTAWLCRHRVRVLDWPACSSDRSHIENTWHKHIKRRIRQQLT